MTTGYFENGRYIEFTINPNDASAWASTCMFYAVFYGKKEPNREEYEAFMKLIKKS